MEFRKIFVNTFVPTKDTRTQVNTDHENGINRQTKTLIMMLTSMLKMHLSIYISPSLINVKQNWNHSYNSNNTDNEI